MDGRFILAAAFSDVSGAGQGEWGRADHARADRKWGWW